MWRTWSSLVCRIADEEPGLIGLSDEALRKRSLSLRYRIQSGESSSRVLPEAFALVREAARRRLNMRHYDVQMLGGIAMHDRAIAEMQTGEGKTLTATLPIYLAALAGKGTHLATANDYLARRDADWMRPVYEALGLTVGVVEASTPRSGRRAAYQCDVTYGTAKEFGFDYLRDRLLLRQLRGNIAGLPAGAIGGDEASYSPVQRSPYFALIDEADSILIDEARTPLIISAVPDDDRETSVALYRWAAQVAPLLEEEVHFECEADTRAISLTGEGRRFVRRQARPETLSTAPWYDIYEHMELAIRVRRDFLRDEAYVVRDGEVVIVDEFTGRLGEGRKWRAGIHQAVEAKEGLEISLETGQAARVTVQDYFLRYERLAGMTGTAANSARELKKIYGLSVVRIPTNRPPIRRQLPTLVYGTGDARWAAVVEEIRQVLDDGRPVLVGTRSIDKSEHLSRLLREAGIRHEVLNARQLSREAEIVARAGEPGRVTVATNMAGRGTDIRLAEQVEQRGGLHVILTEMHESARIDRQLIGRCGRQGDAGSYRQFLALDDDLLADGLGSKKAETLRRRGEIGNGEPRGGKRWFLKAQRRTERRHFRQRKNLLRYERERAEAQQQLGQDPHLDSPS